MLLKASSFYLYDVKKRNEEVWLKSDTVQNYPGHCKTKMQEENEPPEKRLSACGRVLIIGYKWHNIVIVYL